MIMAKNRGEMTITLRMKGRPVVLVGEGPVADEHRSLLTRAGAVIVAEGSKATFAVVIDDRAAVSRLKMRGALVYAVGEPDLSDFTPAADPEPVKPTRKAKPVADIKPKFKFKPKPEPAPDPEPKPELAPEPKSELESEPKPELDSEPKPELDSEPKPEPVVAAPRERPVTVRRERPVKPPREPVVKAPREPLKLPTVSFQPALRGLGTGKSWIVTSCKRAQAGLAPLFKVSTPFTRTVASNIQDRVERARAQPISLDMALLKGGPLDDQAGADGTEAEAAPPAPKSE
jgi:hypothetical protein